MLGHAGRDLGRVDRVEIRGRIGVAALPLEDDRPEDPRVGDRSRSTVTARSIDVNASWSSCCAIVVARLQREHVQQPTAIGERFDVVGLLIEHLAIGVERVLVRRDRRLRVARLLRGARLRDVARWPEPTDRSCSHGFVAADGVARLALTGAGGDEPTCAQPEQDESGQGRGDQAPPSGATRRARSPCDDSRSPSAQMPPVRCSRP